MQQAHRPHPEQLAERAAGAARLRVRAGLQAQRRGGHVVEELHVRVGVRGAAAGRAVHALAHAQPEAGVHHRFAAIHLKQAHTLQIGLDLRCSCSDDHVRLSPYLSLPMVCCALGRCSKNRTWRAESQAQHHGGSEHVERKIILGTMQCLQASLLALRLPEKQSGATSKDQQGPKTAVRLLQWKQQALAAAYCNTFTVAVARGKKH